jgi:8-oxo-dGTP pyrophosphatase MutT (NUDIX family)
MEKRKEFVATAFIVHGQRVLLMLHSGLKKWIPVGGHIEQNETPEQALRREVKEEVGIEVEIQERAGMKFDYHGDTKSLLSPRIIRLDEIDDEHQHINLTYFAKSRTSKITPEEDKDMEDLRWFSEKDLDSNLIPKNVRHLGKLAIKEMGW